MGLGYSGWLSSKSIPRYRSPSYNVTLVARSTGLTKLRRQTKPGGWIEVVENGPTSSRICPATTDENNKLTSGTDNMVAGFGTLNIACWIKQQLIDAGFVEVEEKAWKVSNRPWQKTIAGIGKFIVAFLSMRWVWDDTGTICQEKPQIQHFEPRWDRYNPRHAWPQY